MLPSDSALPTFSRQTVLKLFLLSCAVVVPFCGKAFHIDDTYYLAVTEHILKEPLRPYSFKIDWGLQPESAFKTDNNPPLFQYWTAIFAGLFGPREIPLHLSMLPFTMLALGSAWWLCGRFLQNPLIPFLCFALSPAFIVSHNIMLDVPLTALCLSSAACWIAGVDSGRKKCLVAAGTLAGLAILTKYSGLAILPVLFFYSLFRRNWRSLFFLAVPLVLFALWGIHGIIVYGRPHFGGRGYSKSFGQTVEMLRASGRCLAASAFPAFLFLALKWNWRTAFAAGLAAALSCLARWPWKGPAIERGLEVLFILNLALILVLLMQSSICCMKRAWKRSAETAGHTDDAFLLTWFAVFVVFNIAVAQFVAVRHFLPVLPALLVLIFRQVECSSVKEEKTMPGLGQSLALVFTAVFGFAVAVADMEQANVFRDQAQVAADVLKANENPVWFAGHWGWQFYAAKAGLKPFNLDGPKPQPGALLLIPVGIHRQYPEMALNLEEVDRFHVPGASVLRTVNLAARANFYAVYADLLPYTFSTGPMQVFSLYRVGKK